MPLINPFKRPSSVAPVPQLHLSLSPCLHIKHAALNSFFFQPLHLVFLPALPNGLMDWGCIGATRVCGGRAVSLSPVSGRMCERLHNGNCTRGSAPSQGSLETARDLNLHNPIPTSSDWLAALLLIWYKVMHICACACGTGWPLHFKHWGWWERQRLLLSNSLILFIESHMALRGLQSDFLVHKANKYNQKTMPVLWELFFFASIGEMLML